MSRTFTLSTIAVGQVALFTVPIPALPMCFILRPPRLALPLSLHLWASTVFSSFFIRPFAAILLLLRFPLLFSGWFSTAYSPFASRLFSFVAFGHDLARQFGVVVISLFILIGVTSAFTALTCTLAHPLRAWARFCAVVLGLCRFSLSTDFRFGLSVCERSRVSTPVTFPIFWGGPGIRFGRC